MPWNQVTIVGVGLIGGSLGLALKSRGLASRVVGVGHRRTSLEAAEACGAADETFLEPAEGVRGSDLVVLATPISLFRTLLEAAAPALAEGVTVIDVGSVKGAVVAQLEPLMPPGAALVPCHPIAGSERRGIHAAREDLFDGHVCVVTPSERTPPPALERAVGTWQALGMHVRTLSAEDHDRLLAQVSHLPHLAAAALVEAISEEAEGLTGPGWADTTRVASGDPALWRDILSSNALAVADALRRAEALLRRYREDLAAGRSNDLEGRLAAAKARRDRLVAGCDEAAHRDEKAAR